jgi:hypothetical protein
MRCITFSDKLVLFGSPMARECQKQRGFSLPGQAPPDHVLNANPQITFILNSPQSKLVKCLWYPERKRTSLVTRILFKIGVGLRVLDNLKEVTVLGF